MNLTSSDRKKLLSLPFYMAKRSELPEPRRGQFEFKLFEETYGMGWHDDENIEIDEEEKITEFNYEKFIPAEVLATMDTDSESFKNLIRKMNFYSKTKYE